MDVSVYSKPLTFEKSKRLFCFFLAVIELDPYLGIPNLFRLFQIILRSAAFTTPSKLASVKW